MLNQRTFIAVYLSLILICAALLVVSSLSPDGGLFSVAADAFKTVVGAAVGAMSTLLTEKKK